MFNPRVSHHQADGACAVLAGTDFVPGGEDYLHIHGVHQAGAGKMGSFLGKLRR